MTRQKLTEREHEQLHRIDGLVEHALSGGIVQLLNSFPDISNQSKIATLSYTLASMIAQSTDSDMECCSVAQRMEQYSHIMAHQIRDLLTAKGSEKKH